MKRLKITAKNMVVQDDGGSKHVAALKQGYDGGWSLSSDPEPLDVDMPNATFETREDLIEALRGAGYDVSVEPSSREGSGN